VSEGRYEGCVEWLRRTARERGAPEELVNAMMWTVGSERRMVGDMSVASRPEWGAVRPALVLDLDGTVRFNGREPFGFVNAPEDVDLFAGVEEVLWSWRERGYLICGASNQGGVAYGILSPEDVQRINDATIDRFVSNPFHAIVNCYHHPGGNVEPWCHRSLSRKPGYGMLVELEAKARSWGYVLDWLRSIVVGDRDEDLGMAAAAGVPFVWADTFFERERVEHDRGGARTPAPRPARTAGQ
jgi:D-glycero-D-manno-heptose 1,7-bisphosphate phosphatase